MAGVADAVRAAWESGSLNALVASLENVDELVDPHARSLLLGLVETELRAEEPALCLSVARSPVRRLDLVALTRECLRIRGGVRALRAAALVLFGEAGPAGALLAECDRVLDLEPSLLTEDDRAGLLDLLDGISLTADADVPSLFVEATRPVPVHTAASTMVGAVHQLERRGTAVPLLRFLELLANHSDHNVAVDDLRGWIDAHLDLVEAHRRAEVTGLRDAVRSVDAKTRTCLLVRVEPAEDDTYLVMAWLSQTDAPFGPNCGPEEIVTLDELQRWLREFIARYALGALDPRRRPLIEFVLPPSHLNEPVDTWKLTGGERLGALYQVTVRPLARPAAALPLLEDRWKVLVAGARVDSPAPESMRWLHSTGSVSAEPDWSGWAWMAVTCPLVGRQTAAVNAVLSTGTPVAVWLRGDHAAAARRAVLEGLSRGRLVTQLPDAVRKFRENGWHDDSHHRDLVLLWDDPTRPPPSSYLVNAPERRT